MTSDGKHASDSPTKDAITLTDLSHRYGTDDSLPPVLNRINARIPAQGVVALLGQSGSGKSTLLNLISGLEPLQTGHIDLLGNSLGSLSDQQRTLLRRQRIGFVYQAFNLIPTLTVQENISLPLALNGIHARAQKDRVAELTEPLGIASKANQFPDRLSGGEQQRVAIARALVHQPDLVLADEPTGNLDAATGRRVLDTLLNVSRVERRTLMLVTHSEEVAAAADLTLTLEDGNLTLQTVTSVW